MTRDKDFKKLVRRRSGKTGESYSVARRHLLASDADKHRPHPRVRRKAQSMQIARVIPILRSFDSAKAREFYVDYLGMEVDWEHRFEPHLPLYMQLSKGDLTFHISEHHGDGTPGSTVYIEVTDLADIHSELAAKHYDNLNPGLNSDELGTWMSLLDPFGNTLRFHQRTAE